MLRSRSVLASTAAAAALALVLPTSAANASPAVSDPIATGLAMPLQIDVGHRGQIYVAQSAAGLITKVSRNGTTTDLVTGSADAVVSKRYSLAYTAVVGTEAHPRTLLKHRLADGTTRTIANLTRYERQYNPDADNVYGFLNLAADCAAQIPDGGGEPTPAIIDSHPYALANAPGGGWYVAEAGGNAILRVWPNGHIKTVWVAPAQKIVVTAEIATAQGLPNCTVGKSFAFDPVPTDVEVGRSGWLVVSLLPGGPEDESLGARGAVYAVNPYHGKGIRLASGFLGATNVAIGSHGKIYVAELFGNKISVLKHDHVRTVADLPSPAGVEYAHGKLYASIDVFGPAGSIVRIRP